CLPSPRRRGLPPAFWPDRPAPPVPCGAASLLPCRGGVPAFPAPAEACQPLGRSHARPQKAPAVPRVQLAWLHCRSLGTDDAGRQTAHFVVSRPADASSQDALWGTDRFDYPRGRLVHTADGTGLPAAV